MTTRVLLQGENRALKRENAELKKELEKLREQLAQAAKAARPKWSAT